jgi:hypothetical protein
VYSTAIAGGPPLAFYGFIQLSEKAQVTLGVTALLLFFWGLCFHAFWNQE